MTDDEILDETLRLATPRYLEHIKPNRDFSKQEFIDEAIKMLDFEFRFSRRITFFKEFSVQEAHVFDALVSRLMPVLEERAAAAETEYRKEQMKKEINKAKAEALIAPPFESAGFKVRIEYYTQKAFVKVCLINEEWTMFWVTYEDLDKKGYLEELVATACGMRDRVICKKPRTETIK